MKTEIKIQWRQIHSDENALLAANRSNCRWSEMSVIWNSSFVWFCSFKLRLLWISSFKESNIFVFFHWHLDFEIVQCAPKCVKNLQAGKQNNCAMTDLAGLVTTQNAVGVKWRFLSIWRAQHKFSRSNLIKSRQYLITLRFRKSTLNSFSQLCVFRFAFSLGEIPCQLSERRRKSKHTRILGNDSWKWISLDCCLCLIRPSNTKWSTHYVIWSICSQIKRAHYALIIEKTCRKMRCIFFYLHAKKYSVTRGTCVWLKWPKRGKRRT